MIGVVANEAEHRVVVELFEFFKTPWEFHRPGAHYDILICSNSMVPENNARLLFLYGAQRQAFEECRNITTISASRHDFVSFRGERMPIYGRCLLFDSPGNEVVIHERTKSAAAVSVTSGGQIVVRLGFDLFEEVRYLLTDVLHETQQRCPLGWIRWIGETGESKLGRRFPSQPVLQAPDREFNPPQDGGE